MIDILVIAYTCNFTEGKMSIFLFYPNGEWDEDKLTIQEALKNYPIDKYNWLIDDA